MGSQVVLEIIKELVEFSRGERFRLNEEIDGLLDFLGSSELSDLPGFSSVWDAVDCIIRKDIRTREQEIKIGDSWYAPSDEGLFEILKELGFSLYWDKEKVLGYLIKGNFELEESIEKLVGLFGGTGTLITDIEKYRVTVGDLIDKILNCSCETLEIKPTEW